MPSLPAFTFLAAPVDLLVAVATAVVTTALFGSFTTPLIAPVEFCAKAWGPIHSSRSDIASARNGNVTLVCIDLLLLLASHEQMMHCRFELQACARLKTSGERARVATLILPERCSVALIRSWLIPVRKWS